MKSEDFRARSIVAAPRRGPMGSDRSLKLTSMGSAASFCDHEIVGPTLSPVTVVFSALATCFDAASISTADTIGDAPQAFNNASAITRCAPDEGWMRPGIRAFAPAGSNALAFFNISTTGAFRSATSMWLRRPSSLTYCPYRTRTPL